MNTCRGCPTRWTGLTTSHCAGCHETFTTVSNFDRHRRGGECVRPSSAGLIASQRGGNAVWHQPAGKYDIVSDREFWGNLPGPALRGVQTVRTVLDADELAEILEEKREADL